MTSAPISARAGLREWLALGVLILAVGLLAIDATVLYLAVPSLTAELNPSANQILWIGDVYSFVLAGLLVTMGNIADRIGRKRLLLLGSVLFGTASLFAAYATSPEQLIAARVLLGVGGATIMPSTLSIVRQLFNDPVQRTRAIAIWAAGATGGMAAGPLVGGALLERFWWGSVFLINVPIMVLVLLFGLWLLPESRNPNAGRIDVLSSLLSIVSIVSVVYAVKHTFGSGLDAVTLAASTLGVVAGVIFVRRQRRQAEPLVDIELFRIPAFSGTILANTLAIFALSGVLFFLSQYLQLVRGLSPLWAGVAETPTTFASIAVVAVVGVLVRRLGTGGAVATGLLVAALGVAGLAVSEALPGFLWLALSLATFGMGVGVAMTLSTDAIVSSVPKERAGAASSLAETAYELGVALGIAVLGSIQTALYRTRIDLPAGTLEEIAAAAGDSLGQVSDALRGDGGSPVLEVSRHAFTYGLQVTSAVAAALLLAAAVIAWRVIPSTVTDRQGGRA